MIGQTHPEAKPAAGLLMQQGFRNRGYVDIFDAGPCVDVFIDDLEVLRTTRPTILSNEPTAQEDLADPMLICTPALDSFAVAYGSGSAKVGVVATDQAVVSALGLNDGDTLLATPLGHRAQ